MIFDSDSLAQQGKENESSKCTPVPTGSKALRMEVTGMANLWDIRKQLQEHIDWCEVVINAIDYIDRKARQHDCNDCMKSVTRSCEYLPGLGEDTRVNCPLWEVIPHD